MWPFWGLEISGTRVQGICAICSRYSPEWICLFVTLRISVVMSSIGEVSISSCLSFAVHLSQPHYSKRDVIEKLQLRPIIFLCHGALFGGDIITDL